MTEEIVSYGVLSLIPAILAVVLAFWTKNVIISLMASLFVGCLITAGWTPGMPCRSCSAITCLWT